MSTAQAMAQEIAQLARDQGVADPAIRGADWRMATVATVGTDGTVTTTDGIVARRLTAYQLPAVGDQIVISQASSGSWLAMDRTAPTASDGWRTPSLTAPWAAYSGGGAFRGPRYRRVGGEVVIEGLLDTGGTSVSGTQAIFALLPDYVPNAGYVFAALATGPAARQMSVLPSGVVQISSLPAAAVGFLSINCRYSLL